MGTSRSIVGAMRTIRPPAALTAVGLILLASACGNAGDARNQELVIPTTAASVSTISPTPTSAISPPPTPAPQAAPTSSIDCNDPALSQEDYNEKCLEIEPTAPTPDNPVPILKKIKGCDPGDAVAGQEDISGNRYASCPYPGSQELEVRTYPGAPKNFAGDSGWLQSRDDKYAIVGRTFIVSIWYPDESVNPRAIAKEVGGTFIERK